MPRKKSNIRKKSNKVKKSRRKSKIRKSYRKSPVTCKKDKHDFYFNPNTKVVISENHVSIGDMFIKTEVPVSVTLSTRENTYVFKNPELLGFGTFGAVISYTDTKHNLEITLKLEGCKHGSEFGPGEKNISEVLNKNKNKCNVLRVRYIKTDKKKVNIEYWDSDKNKQIKKELMKNCHYYIMEKYQGDLGNLLDYLPKNFDDYSKMSKKEKFKLMKDYFSERNRKKIVKVWLKSAETIRKQIICLAELGFYYTDLKAENVLYCKKSDGTFSVSLGDLGSAFNKYQKFFSYNLLPPEFKENTGTKIFFKNGKFNKRKVIAFLTFSLGVFLISVIDTGYSGLTKDGWKKYTLGDFSAYIQDLNQHPLLTQKERKKMYEKRLDLLLYEDEFTEKQKKLIKSLLAFDPEDRLKLVDIYKPFKF